MLGEKLRTALHWREVIAKFWEKAKLDTEDVISKLKFDALSNGAEIIYKVLQEM
jgi:hypothetical protein